MKYKNFDELVEGAKIIYSDDYKSADQMTVQQEWIIDLLKYIKQNGSADLRIWLGENSDAISSISELWNTVNNILSIIDSSTESKIVYDLTEKIYDLQDKYNQGVEEAKNLENERDFLRSNERSLRERLNAKETELNALNQRYEVLVNSEIGQLYEANQKLGEANKELYDKCIKFKKANEAWAEEVDAQKRWYERELQNRGLGRPITMRELSGCCCDY